MPTYEELVAAGATPGPEAEPAQPSAGPKGLTYDELVAQGATPGPATAQPGAGKVSAGRAFERGAVSGASFGAGSAISAAIDTAAAKALSNQRAPGPLESLRKSFLNFFDSDTGGAIPLSDSSATYEQRRAAYQDKLKQASQQHPYAFGAGEFAGSAAIPVPGSGVGGTVAKKLGGGAGARLLGAGITGGIAAGEFGAGSAIGAGEGPVDILKSAGKSAAVGAGIGAGLHGTAELAGKAASKASKALQEKYVQLFGGEVLGSTSKKATTAAWTNILGKEPEPGVTITAKKYIQSPELAPVESAARAGHYDEAIEEIDKNLSKYSPGRQANYAKLEDGGQFEVGKADAAFDKSLFEARNKLKDPQAVSALEAAKKQWRADYASADAKQIQAILRSSQNVSPEASQQLSKIADELPKTGRISRSQYAKAADAAGSGPEAIDFLTRIEKTPSGPEKGAEPAFFKWDPKATIPAVELRAQATARQQSALQAFDALNPNNSVHAKTAIKQTIVGALENHLDEVAKSGPEFKAAVDRIRNDDVKFSVLIAAKKGLQEALAKQQRQELNLASRHTGLTAFGVPVPHNLSALGAIPFAVKAGGLGASIANNRLTPVLQRLQNNPAAQGLLSRVPQGVIGTTTLSQGVQQ